MIETFTPTDKFMDLVINHPAVRPTVQRGTERLSASTIADGNATAYAYHGGFALFIPISPTTYEGHIFTLPSSRGREALQFGQAAITRLFAEHRPSKLCAAVPMCLPQARMYCRRLGLKPVSRDLFNEYFSVEIESWAV